MTAAIETATLFLPIAASSGVFAVRRMNKGFDEFDTNPVYGISNIMIAGGQTLKGLRSVKDMTLKTGTPSSKEAILRMSSKIQGLADSNKFFGACKNVFSFISGKINPLICLAETFKVLGSDDKADAAVRGMFGLGTMFAFENFGKKFLGMPYTNCVKGGWETVERDALYKSIPVISGAAKAFEDACMSKKLFNRIALTSLPGAVKGILFVTLSIGGYKSGKWLAGKILGEETDTKQTTAVKNAA